MESFDDWYDEALKAGQGFQSEIEKKAYFDALGDPFDHPLFCNDPEKLAKHPLTDGIRQIKEEDKSNMELAIMYKEEGNEWMKHKTVKELHAARDSYTYALQFIEKAYKDIVTTEATSSNIGSNDSENMTHLTQQRAQLYQLHSQLLSNRGMTALTLKNYGECIEDCSRALILWPQNIKAYYRKCKSLYFLKRYQECKDWCENYDKVDKDNKEISQIRQQCMIALEQLHDLELSKQQKIQQYQRLITTSYQLAEKYKVLLKAPEVALPPQLRDTISPLQEYHNNNNNNDSNDQIVYWNILLLYPQYNKIDILQSIDQNTMIAEPLSMALPEEIEDHSIVWDKYHEYRISNICAYIRINMLEIAENQHQYVQGWLNIEQPTQLTQEEEDNEEDRIEYVRKYQYTQKTDIVWLEFHLGTNVLQLLTAPHHVIVGGVLHIVVFARENAAHMKFKKDARTQGEKFGYIDPMGVVTMLAISDESTA